MGGDLGTFAVVQLQWVNHCRLPKQQVRHASKVQKFGSSEVVSSRLILVVLVNTGQAFFRQTHSRRVTEDEQKACLTFRTFIEP